MSERCGARTRSGNSCAKPAGWGTPSKLGRCSLHGGNTRNHRKSVMRREAEAAVATYGLPRDVDPSEALLDEVRWTAGHVAWLRERVQEIEQDELVWGMTEQVERTATEFAGTDTTHKAIPSVWLDLYQKERKHLLDVCKAALAAGVEERRVRLAEKAGALLANVIKAILEDLELTPDQQAKVASVVPFRLRQVAT